MFGNSSAIGQACGIVGGLTGGLCVWIAASHGARGDDLAGPFFFGAIVGALVMAMLILGRPKEERPTD